MMSASIFSAMASTQLLVSPKLPTALADDTHIELPGYDIWLFAVRGVYVVPIEIDRSKFEDALSRTLQLYPHTVGRLRCSDGRWSVELTNSALPVEIVQKVDMSADSLLDGNCVFQDDISPFLSSAPMGANLVNSDDPLFRLKLTFFHHETSIGILWNHSLGDGVVISHFFHTLSQFYQGLPRERAAPTFKKHHFPLPSPSTMNDLLPCLPSVLAGEFDEARYINSLKDLAHVRWCIDAHDLEVLRSSLLSGKQNRSFLSKTDCLIAYFVSILNSCRINPMRMVTNTTTYRYASAPFVSENVASNMFVVVSAEVPADMSGIATAVRDARIQSREPYYIYTMATLASKIMLDSANAARLPPFQTDDNNLIVNSHVGIDWHSAHFGYPDETRFFMGGVDRHYLKISRPNPVREADGVWWRSRQSMDISLGVPAELKRGILEKLARGVQYMLNGERARL